MDKLLVGLLLAISLHAFDDIAIITMLPSIVDQLQGHDFYGASFFAYLLASLISLVWAGFVTDREGPARPFAIGIFIFAVGLVVGALSTNMPQFVLGRALQGLGGGAIHSVVFAAINLAYNESQQKRAIALLTTAWILPAILAPMIAGFITEHLDWHWVFWGLLPMAVLVGFATRSGLMAYTKVPEPLERQHFIATLLTALRIAAGVGVMLSALNFLSGFLLEVAILVSIFIFWRPLNSVFPSGIWLAKPGVAACLAIKFLVVFSYFGIEAFIPALLTGQYNYSPFAAGAVITGAAICWTSATWVYERYSDLMSAQHWMVLGCSTMMVGALVLILGLTVYAVPFMGYLAWSVTSLGMGLAYPLAMSGVMTNTDSGSEGHTATGAGMVDALGISFATGIGGAILNNYERVGLERTDGIQVIWCIMLLVALIAALVSYKRFNVPVQDDPTAGNLNT